MAEINQVHRSIPPGGIVPRRMSKVRMTADQSAFLADFALSIFADCTNAGRTLQESITAVYLSGLLNGADAITDEDPRNG